jgi:hypothetical protein
MKEQSSKGHVSAFSIEDGVTSPWVSLNLSVLPIKRNSSRVLSSLDIMCSRLLLCRPRVVSSWCRSFW